MEDGASGLYEDDILRFLLGDGTPITDDEIA